MPKTPRGIEYPDGTNTYPEAPWWERLASTANSAFDAVYTALGGKADTAHTHAEADVSGLVTDLAGKAPTAHTHAASDITGASLAAPGEQDLTGNYSATPTAGPGWELAATVDRVGAHHAFLSGSMWRRDTAIGPYADSVTMTLPGWAMPTGERGFTTLATAIDGGDNMHGITMGAGTQVLDVGVVLRGTTISPGDYVLFSTLYRIGA